MEEPGTVRTAKDSESVQAGLKRDWGLLAFLLLLATSIHAWQIGHSEVAARDSIGFIRYALQLEQQPWPQVFRESLHPPVYPLTVLAVSLPVRHILGGTTCDTMTLSAQLASSLAAVLLVIPMFYLGKALFDRGVGFWAAAMFQCLPAGSRVLGDGLAEAVFLLAVASALLLAVWGLRMRSVIFFGGCGVCGGLAYLTRPEGVLLIGATGLVLLGVQALPAWRQPWRSTGACAAALALGALAVAGPYMALIGGITNKTSGGHILKSADGVLGRAGGVGHCRLPIADCRLPNHREGLPSAGNHQSSIINHQLLASVWAAWSPDYQVGHRSGHLWWGLKAVAAETVRGFHYLVWLPALAGLWWFRDRLRADPGAWVLLLLCLLHGLVLWRLAAVMGYVSERHTLLIVLVGVFWAVAAVRELPAWLSARGYRLPGISPPLGSFLLLSALTVYGLPTTLKPFHANRTGHRQAGLWLAEHVQPGDIIVDPFCWAAYYAGQTFQEVAKPAVPPGYPATHYVVLENSDNLHPRLPVMPIAQRLANRGTVVYRCPIHRAKKTAGEVLVYAVPSQGGDTP